VKSELFSHIKWIENRASGHTRAREKPARLAEKLVLIRQSLGLSQDGVIRQIGVVGKITREDISKYERGLREPSLPILLEYARAAGIWVDVLIDDDLDLPEKLPSPRKHAGIKGTRVAASKRK
jgi:transcriptional regulator with XRE-family HTH domain